MRRRRDESMEERFMRSGAVEPTPDRREVHPTASMLLAGIRRFLLLTAGVAAVAAGLGVLVGYLRGGDLGRYVTLALYVGGGILVAFGAFTFSSEPRQWVGEWGEDLGTGSDAGEAGAFVAVGVALIGIGLALDTAGI